MPGDGHQTIMRFVHPLTRLTLLLRPSDEVRTSDATLAFTKDASDGIGSAGEHPPIQAHTSRVTLSSTQQGLHFTRNAPSTPTRFKLHMPCGSPSKKAWTSHAKRGSTQQASHHTPHATWASIQQGSHYTCNASVHPTSLTVLMQVGLSPNETHTSVATQAPAQH